MKPSSCVAFPKSQHLTNEIVYPGMTDYISQPLLQIARQTMLELRAAAAAGAAGGGVDLLRDSGHAGGRALHDAFARSLREKGAQEPAELTLGEFSNRAETFFREA